MLHRCKDYIKDLKHKYIVLLLLFFADVIIGSDSDDDLSQALQTFEEQYRDGNDIFFSQTTHSIITGILHVQCMIMINIQLVYKGDPHCKGMTMSDWSCKSIPVPISLYV